MVLSGGDTGSGLRAWFARLTSERRPDEPQPASVSSREPADGPVVTSKALQKFLAYLGTRPAPVLLDLGPFSGSNITYFGQLLSCKVLIGDVFTDLERHVREGRIAEIPSFLSKRFTHDEASVDGVLLWDVYDYLERPAAQALSTALVRALRPDGALLGFFGSSDHTCIGCTKFVVEDESHVRLRPYASGLERHSRLQNREILKMFEGLRVSDSYLLQNGWREMLFRKGGTGRPII
jgi:hypothetical protein